MKKKEPIFFLKDIENSLNKIFKYTQGISYNEFVENDLVKDAVERNFEIIWEAVKNLSDDFRNQYPNIPFKQVAGMRDKLIHDYFGIDYEILWKTVQDKLPQFKSDIEELIKLSER